MHYITSTDLTMTDQLILNCIADKALSKMFYVLNVIIAVASSRPIL